MKNTLLASEIDDILQRNIFKYIDEEDDGVVRHPSNRGSVIIDGPNKIFVPDAKYRKKKVALNSYTSSYDKFRFDESRPYIYNLFIETQQAHNSTEINNKVLKFNNDHLQHGYYISSFDICNNIKVPKVGTCIIPSYEQIELIMAYHNELDELDMSIRSNKNMPFDSYRNCSNVANKSFRKWFYNIWATEFITCDFKTRNYHDYGGRDISRMQIMLANVNSRYETSPYYDDIYDEKYALIPIIEL